MATIYRPTLIDPNDTGLLAYVEETYDRKQLREIIWDSQELYLLPILGTALYEELKTQIRANTLTLLNITLLEKINPVLKWRTLADGATVFTYKIRNKGIVTQSSDNAQPASLADLNFLVTDFTNKYEAYAKRLMNYLIENSTSFPLYENAGSGVDTIHPTSKQQNVGWYMGNSNPYGNYNPCCNGENEVQL